MKPSAHKQVNVADGRSTHVAPFSHGDEMHALNSSVGLSSMYEKNI